MKFSKWLSASLMLIAPLVIGGVCWGLSEKYLETFSQYDIMFYDPEQCATGSSGVCGSTAKEMYWSALRQTFGEVPAAGIMGNIMHEGGFNPVLVEACDHLNPFDFRQGTWKSGWSWEIYSTGVGQPHPSGVGAFGTTSERAKYIQSAPEDLLQYFQHPELYSFCGCSGAPGLGGAPTSGDALLAKIGETDFGRLVKLDVDFLTGALERLPSFDLEAFKEMTDPGEAAVYFSMHYEKCQGCLEAGSATNQGRRASGQKAYDEFADFACTISTNAAEGDDADGADGDAGASGSSDAGAASGEAGADGSASADGNGNGNGANASGDANVGAGADGAGTTAASGIGATGTSASGVNATSEAASQPVEEPVTLIGDSIAVMAENELKEKFPNGFLNMVGSRHLTNGSVCGDEGGLTTLRKLAAGSGVIAAQHVGGDCEIVAVHGSSLADNVVWELGGNTNGADREHIEQVVELVGERNLYLVTPYNGLAMATTDAIAETYRAVANEHDNVYIVDWNKAVREDEATYITRADGMAVHPTAAGRQLLADLIAEAINGGADCISDAEFPYYAQYDPKWKNAPFGTSTVGRGGCGPTSFAMMASALLGRSILPDETGRVAGEAGMYIQGAGSSWQITEVLAAHYGLEFKSLSARSPEEAVEIINEYLRQGWMIHTSGQGSEPFTRGGHYIGIRGIASDGNWLIADSGHREEYTTTRTWEPLELVRSGMHIANIKAIRGPRSGVGACGDACLVGEGETTRGGFRAVEDARGIIEAYQKDDLEGLGLIMPATGDRHHNCVAFSTWFINHYTDITYIGGADGWQYVDRFYQEKKGEYPDLKISNTPSVYALASWGEPPTMRSGGNHTGIVVGIDQAKGKILIAEAGWNNPGVTGVHEYNLSDAMGSPNYKYINLNAHLKPNMGLD